MIEFRGTSLRQGFGFPPRALFQVEAASIADSPKYFPWRISLTP